MVAPLPACGDRDHFEVTPVSPIRVHGREPDLVPPAIAGRCAVGHELDADAGWPAVNVVVPVMAATRTCDALCRIAILNPTGRGRAACGVAVIREPQFGCLDLTDDEPKLRREGAWRVP